MKLEITLTCNVDCANRAEARQHITSVIDRLKQGAIVTESPGK